jgi:tRNA 2-thiouridine synthesizing protein D
MGKKTSTIALMDPPYESENLTTAFRILDVAARRGHHVNVFAYEGASGLAFVRQNPHPNPVHGKNLAEENHPTTKDQVAALLAEAERNGGKIDWANCGMCVDERGVGEFVPGTRRGSPADFHTGARVAGRTATAASRLVSTPRQTSILARSTKRE